VTKRNPDIASDFFGGEEVLDRLVGSRRGAELINARIEDIDPNPYNPRQVVDVSELVESLKEHGFMGALDGRLVGDRVQLAYGARRLRAAQLAGISHIPVYIHPEWDENVVLTVSLVENVQREDLTPTEAAQMVARMSQDLHWSQEEIGRRTGKSRTWVRDMLALAQAPSEVKELVQERPEAIRHARYLVAVQDEEARRELTRATREEGFSQPQVYRAAQALQQGATVQEALEQARRPAADFGGATSSGQPMDPDWIPPDLVVPEPGLEAAAAAKPQVRTRSTVQALLWAIYGRLERVSLADVREEALGEPAALWAVIRAIHRALDNVIAQLPEEPSADSSAQARGPNPSTADARADLSGEPQGANTPPGGEA
jgi:ParB/RepB/Spo0J family partition protein